MGWITWGSIPGFKDVYVGLSLCRPGHALRAEGA